MLLKDFLYCPDGALCGSALMAQNFKYIGAAKCKMCHMKPAKGKQFDVWQEGPHANAMKTLANEESKKIAAEKGIADPTTDAACIKCHATVASVDAKLIAWQKWMKVFPASPVTDQGACTKVHRL